MRGPGHFGPRGSCHFVPAGSCCAMVRRSYTGLIRADVKIAEAKALYLSLREWKNDLRPFSPEYVAVDETLAQLNCMAEAVTGEPLARMKPHA
jgi:hypothetical protein